MRIDFQTHTAFSQVCGWEDPIRLAKAARDAGLDGIAITDHNTMAGYRALRAESPSVLDDIVVIPAEEIDTSAGQIIGLFLDEQINAGGSPERVVAEIHRQDGLAFAPHPFDELRDGLAEIEQYADVLDAIEVLNSRCVREEYNRRADEFARTYRLPALAGSDAHFRWELGQAWTSVDVPTVATPADIREAILDGRIQTGGKRGRILNHAGTKLAKLYNRLSR